MRDIAEKADGGGGDQESPEEPDRSKRDAAYREALGIADGGELPEQIGNTASAGGGRARAKVARPTRKNKAASGRRATLIG
jgi:hypothetical protein